MAISASPISCFPLAGVTENQLKQLGQRLWSWQVCADCEGFPERKLCATETCPSQRMRRLRRFFEYYKDLTTSYEVEQGLEKDPALRTHEDLLEVIGLLKACPDVARSQLVEKMFSNQPGRKPITVEDQERAINLAVRVLAMINCSGQRQTSTLLEHGMFQTPWRSNISLGQFISDAFPMTDHPTLNDQDVRSSTDVKPALAAKKLKKKLGLAFQPTDDIGSHLKLNHKKNVVEIYHHTSFLKEHLRLTKGQPTNMSVNESLKMYAKIPTSPVGF